MKKLTKFLMISFLVLGLVGCNGLCLFQKQKQPEGNTFGSGKQMVVLYNMGITNHQLDSICVADTLSVDFNDWHNACFVDHETGDSIYRHTFIKNTKDKRETIYIVTEWKDSLSIIKRVKR